MNLKNLLASLAIAGALTLFMGCESKDAKPAAGGTTGGAAASSTTGGAASSTTGGASSSSKSDDEKHKLYQAAASTQDTAIMMEMYKKVGLAKADGSVDAAAMQQFSTAHGEWAQKNVDFITKEVNTPDKAKAYWNAHK